MKIVNSDDFVTEEQALLDAYLSGRLSLQQFWPTTDYSASTSTR